VPTDIKDTYDALISNKELLGILKTGKEPSHIIHDRSRSIYKNKYQSGSIPFALTAFYTYLEGSIHAGFYLFCAILLQPDIDCTITPELNNLGEMDIEINCVMGALNTECTANGRLISAANELHPETISAIYISDPPTVKNIFAIDRTILYVCNGHAHNIHSLSQFNLNRKVTDLSNSIIPPLGRNYGMFQAKAQVQVESPPDNSSGLDCSSKDSHHSYPITLQVTYSKYGDYAVFSTADRLCTVPSRSAGNTMVYRRSLDEGLCINEHIWLKYHDGFNYRYSLVSQICLRPGHFISVIKGKGNDTNWYELSDSSKAVIEFPIENQVVTLICPVLVKQ
jgi:hypothetical protein